MLDSSCNFHFSATKLKIIGGYPNQAKSDDKPNPDVNVTIFSGDIGHDDVLNSTDSTYTIINKNAENVLKVAVGYFELYGITIACGDGGQIPCRQGEVQNPLFPAKGLHYFGGAGLYIESFGNCLIHKCKFISNRTKYSGGAISFFSEGAYGTMNIDSSIFLDNTSYTAFDGGSPQISDKIGGGAIYSRSQKRNIEILNSIFRKCTTTNAGGAINSHSDSALIIINCRFENNSSGSDGGAIYALSNKCIISDSAGKNVFIFNKSTNGSGGAVFLRNDTTIVTGLTDSCNAASDSGGAICIFGKYVNLENSSFKKDSSYKGGACFLYVDSISFDSVTFSESHANRDGGALAVGTNVGTIRNSSFLNNKSERWGGAFWGGGSNNDTLFFLNTRFSQNFAGSNGGAGFFDKGILKIFGCLLYGNSTQLGRSSAFDVSCNSYEINNSSFYNNELYGNAGHSIYLGPGTGKITNCIIWNPGNLQKEICLGPSSNLNIRNSDIKNSDLSIDSMGGVVSCSNIWNFDPLFVDASKGNLDLSENSPCIDRGLSVYTSGWDIDLRGKPRIYNGTIDLGAYEYQGSILPFPPQLLPTLSNFEIRAADTCLIDLNRKNADGSGYYVTYSSRDISELTWTATPPDTNVKIFLDPESNKLVVEVNSKYRIVLLCYYEKHNIYLQAREEQATI